MRLGGFFACLLGLLPGCTPKPPHTPEAKKPGVVAAPPPTGGAAGSAPRLFPPTRGNGVTDAGQEHDGARRLLAFGLRVIEHADGSLEVGDELLPAARSARFLELPQRLGGGFLFWIVSSSGTLLYRSASWTAKLEPFAQLDFEVDRLVPGFDRLLVLARHDAEYRALDLETGKPVPPLGLPAAPAYGAMAFVDGWFGAVQVPLRGLLLSFDAGASWRPLPLPITSFEPSGDSLSLATTNGDYLLSARGQLSRVADRDQAKVAEAARSELSRAIAGKNPAERGSAPLLQSAALSGFPDGHGAALLASGGALLRVAQATGRVLERREHAYVGGQDCSAVRLGSGVGFVCGQGQELTRIYRLVEPFDLELVRELPGARVVSDSDSGSLVIHGACNQPGTVLDYCVLHGDGSSVELRASTARDRVTALADGRVALLTPPEAQGAGKLTLWKAGASEIKPLQVVRAEPRQKALLERGVWLDGVIEARPGVLSGWIVGAGPFAGFELAMDGKLTLRRVQDGAAQALFAGRRALVLGDNGLAAESTDGGTEWQSVELPVEMDLKGARGAGVRQGCSAVGCSFAGFTRIGYFDGHAARSLASPVAPPRVTFAGTGGSRWLLHCSPTGQVSAAALPFRPPTPLSGRRLRRSSTPGDEIELAPLSAFLEQPPPVLPDNFEGVDAGTEPYGVQLRVYAYGPRGGDWSKNGSLSIAFADRFSTQGGVRTTAAARSPWPDATTAADALGAEPSTNAAGLAASLDPGGSSGALLLSSRGTLDLFVFEAGRVPVHLPNVGRLGLMPRLSGVVRTKSGVYLGSYDETARSFRVYKLVGQDLDVVLETADIPPPRGANAELVRSAAGDGLAIWVRSTGWFIHPLDLDTGEVDAPYVVTPAQLARMPEPCASGSEGFLLTSSIGPDPYADAGGVSLRGFEGRFRVSALGVCIDELAAQGEAGAAAKAVTTAARAAGRPTVVTTLTERKPLGRRAELLCSN
ncbi:MAG TPA: hypothetical protein VHB79_28605 [Polyangiaceae bacterium]|nr:hypothetical protein [Polyangiaceae bacterium]